MSKKILININSGLIGIFGQIFDYNMVQENIIWDTTISLQEEIQYTYQWIVNQKNTNEN